MQPPGDLEAALDELLSGIPLRRLTDATTRLMRQYQGGGTGTARKPIIHDDIDSAAYAAYRMPATYGAVRSALREFALLAPDWRPKRHLDIGGGTGAAAWAAADTWPGLEASIIMDWSTPALAVGQALAHGAHAASLRTAQWRQLDLGSAPVLAAADLATASYVLGELGPDTRDALTGALAASAGVVALVEPGTPEGYRRILAARTKLLASGMHVVAPCPHEAPCPLQADRDWCHFAARVNRSSTHRQVKNASLSYEDEKYSYVIASRTPYPHAAGRVLRHPLRRGKLVQLTVCANDGVTTINVPKSQGETYRDAKDAAWGTAWPPVG